MFYIVAGTYNKVLHGFLVKEKASEEEGEGLQLEGELLFVHPAHTSCIKALASSADTLVTGSDDETMRVFHLGKRKEVGVLAQHSGSVGIIKFLSPAQSAHLNKIEAEAGAPSHAGQPGKRSWMLSSAEDGTVVLWRCRDWRPLVSFAACKPTSHFSPLIAAHPSARALLTMGAKGDVKLFNMMKGRCEVKKRLPATSREKPFFGTLPGRELPLDLLWSPSGERYAVNYGSHVAVFLAETGALQTKLEESEPICCITFLDEETLALGTEKGRVSVMDTDSESSIMSFGAHGTRVKCMQTVSLSTIRPECTDSLPLLITASTDGSIRVWDMRILASEESMPTMSPILRLQTGDRITCITASVASARTEEPPATGKRKRRQVDSEEEDASDEEPSAEEAKRATKNKKQKVAKKAPRARVTISSG